MVGKILNMFVHMRLVNVVDLYYVLYNGIIRHLEVVYGTIFVYIISLLFSKCHEIPTFNDH